VPSPLTMSEATRGAQPPLLVIVGPTAVGKSDLALALAERFSGEIVNADSRQLYRRMDIGTAKPPPEARQRAPHHLYDVAEPAEPLGLACYLDMARRTIAEVHGRGRLPIVVGGSGQYVLALLEGWHAPQAPADPALRERLSAEARERGAEALHARLREVDPEAAASIDPRNVRRVIRALEVHHATGRRFSEAKAKTPPPFTFLALGLTTPTRQELHERIDRRVDAMLAAGWLDEVRTLVQAGFGATTVFRASMGYPELARVLSGNITLDEAGTAIKVAHHRLARSQYTWFQRRSFGVHWLTVGPELTEPAHALVSTFLHSAPNL